MKKELLILFIRNPRLGKVKTRLAASIGNEKALRIYQLLLDHTLKITQKSDADKVVYYADFIPANDAWQKAGFKQAIQTGSDLGERMSNAFRSAFIRGYERVVLIGSDCYELTEKEIQEAFEQLVQKQVVIGPATDGGYYLAGLSEHVPALFQNKAWSTPSVFKDTLGDIEKLALTFHLLTELPDIDELNDLLKYDDLFALM
ncbi:MAG: TIGR04282 family arsenosugar biosynthesis glycosyltransferase [Bacteroidetes bacterium]|nr:TIGR04282 family arsenosugar biosynthesis glycosyltransferase [Bacteroidota bacterium]